MVRFGCSLSSSGCSHRLVAGGHCAGLVALVGRRRASHMACPFTGWRPPVPSGPLYSRKRTSHAPRPFGLGRCIEIDRGWKPLLRRCCEFCRSASRGAIANEGKEQRPEEWSTTPHDENERGSVGWGTFCENKADRREPSRKRFTGPQALCDRPVQQTSATNQRDQLRFTYRNASHPGVVGPTPSLRDTPINVLLRILDVTSFAVNAICGADL